RVETDGRRPSRLLLVEKLRATVDKWRDDRYAGASPVTLRLLEYWFDEEHQVSDFPIPFRYYFCQREAIETLVYILEVFRKRDTKPLIERFERSSRKICCRNLSSFEHRPRVEDLLSGTS